MSTVTRSWIQNQTPSKSGPRGLMNWGGAARAGDYDADDDRLPATMRVGSAGIERIRWDKVRPEVERSRAR